MPTTRMSVAAAALLGCFILAGCGGTSSSSDPSATTPPAPPDEATSQDDAAALEAVTLQAEPGEEPDLDFDAPLQISGPAARLVEAGEGEALEEGHLLTMEAYGVSGEDGSAQESTYDAEPQSLMLGDPGVLPQLTDVLINAQVGARALVAAPDGAGGMTVLALEIVEASEVPERAEGEAVEPAEDLPAVTLDDDGVPSVEPLDEAEPEELLVQPLLEGDGEEVAEGDTISVHYSGWLWDGTAFDSSWESGTPLQVTVGAGQVIDGWDSGLQGQPVGSQVMLVVPPDQGYGDQETGEIPPDSTLVFVVDILHAL